MFSNTSTHCLRQWQGGKRQRGEGLGTVARQWTRDCINEMVGMRSKMQNLGLLLYPTLSTMGIYLAKLVTNESSDSYDSYDSLVAFQGFPEVSLDSSESYLLISPRR